MSAVDERTRHELYTDLERVHGKSHAETLMTLLPPDWESLATKEDLTRTETALKEDLTRTEAALNGRIDRLEGKVDRLGDRIDGLETRMDDRFDALRADMKAFKMEVRATYGELRGELYQAIAAMTTRFLAGVATIAAIMSVVQALG